MFPLAFLASITHAKASNTKLILMGAPALNPKCTAFESLTLGQQPAVFLCIYPLSKGGRDAWEAGVSFGASRA